MTTDHTITVNGITYISSDEIESYTCEGCAFDQYNVDCEAALAQHDCFSDENDSGFIWVKQDTKIIQKKRTSRYRQRSARRLLSTGRENHTQ